MAKQAGKPRTPSDKELLRSVGGDSTGTQKQPDLTVTPHDVQDGMNPADLPPELPLPDVGTGASQTVAQDDPVDGWQSDIPTSEPGYSGQETGDTSQSRSPQVQDFDKAVSGMGSDEKLNLILKMLNDLPEEIAKMMVLD